MATSCFLTTAVLLASSLFSTSTAVFQSELDNGLIGTPEILCLTDTIEMRFRTKKPFAGKIYVQGHYNNPECRVDYGEASADGHALGGIKLSHGACDMDRQRMLAPEGIQFSTVLVISFHALFVTKIDRAFHINCMYREAAQTVNQQLEVSALPTEQVQNDMPMPSCKYTIRKDEIDGPILKYAKLGDQVVHRWECESDVYGILVHSCFVDDGQGEKRAVIDERGCHTDRLVLGDPTYVENLNMAYREGYVFKFADRVGVRFQCEIRLCLKDSGGCSGITPPNCDSGLSEAWLLGGSNGTLPARAKRSGKDSHLNVINTDLISQYVYVLEDVDDPEEDDSAQTAYLETKSSNETQMCLSNGFFGVFILIMVALSVGVVAIAVYTLRQQSPDVVCCDRPRIRPCSSVFG